ncbi:MAG: 3-hydroxyacyl-ACP dehydratase FabZ family protein [Thermoguttaceae bacterium]|jgi:3-hydroxyacyl-[acyl-carrier-protein] dehydratase
MYFSLIDKIDELHPGESIVATKSLAMSEEYLRDHFPKFPVMPGVLMLEAMTQASAWLVRVSEQFAHSIVVLKRTKNVKFGQFLLPGQTMVVSSKIVSDAEDETILKVQGSIEGQVRIRAQIALAKYNLASISPHRKTFDKKIVAFLKEELALLWNGYEDYLNDAEDAG